MRRARRFRLGIAALGFVISACGVDQALGGFVVVKQNGRVSSRLVGTVGSVKDKKSVPLTGEYDLTSFAVFDLPKPVHQVGQADAHYSVEGTDRAQGLTAFAAGFFSIAPRNDNTVNKVETVSKMTLRFRMEDFTKFDFTFHPRVENSLSTVDAEFSAKLLAPDGTVLLDINKSLAELDSHLWSASDLLPQEGQYKLNMRLRTTGGGDAKIHAAQTFTIIGTNPPIPLPPR